MKRKIIRYVDGIAGNKGSEYVNTVFEIIKNNFQIGWPLPNVPPKNRVVDNFQAANHSRPPMSEAEANEEMKKWTTYYDYDAINNHSPEQTNGIDCALLMLKYTEHMCFNLELDYCQSDMPLVRRQICCAIARGELFISS